MQFRVSEKYANDVTLPSRKLLQNASQVCNGTFHICNTETSLVAYKVKYDFSEFAGWGGGSKGFS